MSNEKEYAFVGTPDKSPRAQAIDKRERAIELARYWQKPVDQKECHSFVLMCISRQLLAEAKRVDELSATRDELRDMALEQSERIKELKGECARLKGNLSCVGIHTCHEHCERPTCVLRKENEKLMAVVDALKDNGMARELLKGLKATYALMRPVLCLAVHSRAEFERVKNKIETTIEDAERALGPAAPPATPYECEHL